MAKKILNGIDLNGTQLLNWLWQLVAGNPGSPAEAQTWYDSVAKRFKGRTDAATITFATTSDPAGDAATLGGHDSAYHLARANHTGTQLASTISDLDAAITAKRLDQMAAPTSNVSLNSQRLVSVADPQNPQDAVTMAWALARLNGFDWKNSVRAATTAALPANTRTGNVLTASANGAFPAIDGVTLVVGERLLVKNEATGANNGIYTLTDAGGAGAPWVLTRAADADESAEVTPNLSLWVEEGTTNGDTGWILSTNGPITLNTTALTFTQSSGAGQITAGNGLTKSGNTLAVQPGNGILADGTSTRVDPAVVVRKYAAAIGDGAATSIAVTHNLGTRDVTVGLYQAASPYAEVETDVEHTDANNVTFIFATAPASGAYRAVIHG